MAIHSVTFVGFNNDKTTTTFTFLKSGLFFTKFFFGSHDQCPKCQNNRTVWKWSNKKKNKTSARKTATITLWFSIWFYVCFSIPWFSMNMTASPENNNHKEKNKLEEMWRNSTKNNMCTRYLINIGKNKLWKKKKLRKNNMHSSGVKIHIHLLNM